MKSASMVLMPAVVVLGAWLLAGGAAAPATGGPPASKPATEVSQNPSLLVALDLPPRKPGLTVYGIRLGDPVEKLEGNPAFARQPVRERAQDLLYTGRDAWFFATEGKIYRIRVRGEIIRKMPAYNAARLQVALGKADSVVETPGAEGRPAETRVSFFARGTEYTVLGDRADSVVSEVDLYAP